MTDDTISMDDLIEAFRRKKAEVAEKEGTDGPEPDPPEGEKEGDTKQIAGRSPSSSRAPTSMLHPAPRGPAQTGRTSQAGSEPSQDKTVDEDPAH